MGHLTRMAIIGTTLLSSSIAQMEWRDISLAYNTPDVLQDYAITYDSSRNVLVLDRGLAGAPAIWEFDGQYWDRVASAPSRLGHALVFFANLQVAVGFGGNLGLGGTASNDTWTWDGTTLTTLNPTSSPPARSWHAMAYDSHRAKLVLFGGSSAATGLLGDTWEFDGTDWMPIVTPATPSARAQCAMTYDDQRQTTVMFGGVDGTGARNDTWEYDGVNWMPIATPNAPTVITSSLRHSMAFDQSLSKTVLTGGGTTWSFDGNDWTAIATTLGSPGLGAIAYCSGRSRIEGFGGLNTGTWKLATIPSGTPLAQTSIFGTGNLFGGIGATSPPIVGQLLTCGFSSCNDWDQRYYLVLGLSALQQPVSFTGPVIWAPNETWINGTSLLITPDLINFSPWVGNFTYCSAPPFLLHMNPIAIPTNPALAGTHIFGQVLGWQHNGASTYWGMSAAIDWQIGF
jgi:hypothetical protein